MIDVCNLVQDSSHECSATQNFRKVDEYMMNDCSTLYNTAKRTLTDNVQLTELVAGLSKTCQSCKDGDVRCSFKACT